LQNQYDAEARQRQTAGRPIKAGSSSMWVDRYRPKKFADLLGEDVSAFSSLTAVKGYLIVVED
jgi:hypothetical protein